MSLVAAKLVVNKHRPHLDRVGIQSAESIDELIRNISIDQDQLTPFLRNDLIGNEKSSGWAGPDLVHVHRHDGPGREKRGQAAPLHELLKVVAVKLGPVLALSSPPSHQYRQNRYDFNSRQLVLGCIKTNFSD